MTDFISKLKNLKTAVADSIFPVRCPYCGKVIERNDYACFDCKSKFPEKAITRYAIGGCKCASALPYDGIFANGVKRFKFNNNASYAKQLAVVLVMSILEIYQGEKFDLITCVPMHKDGLKERGYNQAELLAKECAEIMHIPYVDTLEKFRKNRTQHSIKASERADNVRGVFRIIDKSIVKNKNILIIDDIITTGHTLGECTRILAKSGCSFVSCATLCSVTM